MELDPSVAENGLSDFSIPIPHLFIPQKLYVADRFDHNVINKKLNCASITLGATSSLVQIINTMKNRLINHYITERDLTSNFGT